MTGREVKSVVRKLLYSVPVVGAIMVMASIFVGVSAFDYTNTFTPVQTELTTALTAIVPLVAVVLAIILGIRLAIALFRRVAR